MQNSKRLNLADEGSKKSAMQATTDLALSIAETSRVTGMSRDAITQSVKAEQEKPKTMLAMLQMSQEQRQQFTAAQAQMAPFGKSLQSLATEMLTGGVRTQEGIAKLNALGPAGAQFEAALKQQQAARTDTEKLAAKQAMDAALAEVTRYQSSAQYAEIANTATGATAEAMANMAGENKALMGTLAASAETGKDLTEAQKAQKQEVQNNINGLTADGKEKDKSQATTRLVNEASERQRIQAEGLTINFRQLNDELSKDTKQFQAFREELLKFSGKETTGEAAAAKNKDLLQQGASKIQEVKEKVSPNATPGGSPVQPPPGYNRGGNRDLGTMGMTGRLFEPEDFIGKVQKGETVLTPEQFGNLVKGAKSGGLEDAMNSLKSAVPSDKETGKADSKGFNLSGIFDKFTTTISSVIKPENKMPLDLTKIGGSALKPEIKMPSPADFMKMPGGMPDIASLAKSSMPDIEKILASSLTAEKKPNENDEETQRRAFYDAQAKEKEQGTPVQQQFAEGEITLKDLHSALMMLNKQTAELVQHSETSAFAQEKTARLTGKASGNRSLA
jgi:hypothetical protein